MNDEVSRRRFLGRSALAATTLSILSGPAAGQRDGRIRIGQIGTEHAHAAGKIAVYRESPDYELVGVVEPDPARRRRLENTPAYRGLRWMTEEQLLNVPGLHAVAVETAVRDLLGVAQTCVNAGLHIHLDKPAGSSLPAFRRVLQTAEREKRTVQLGYMYRYNPAALFLFEALRKGWLGRPFEVHAVMSKVVRREERKALGEFAGGMMFELGCHILDLALAVLGKPREVTPHVQHASDVDDGLADNTLAVLSYPDALATVKSSAMEVEGFSRRHFVVCGSEGTLHIEPLDAPSVRLALSKPREKYRKGYQQIVFGRYPRYVGDAADLARIIRGEKAPDYAWTHDLDVQETLLRASKMPLDS